MPPASNSKSNLIPRDIEKDVALRCKKEDDPDILPMQIEDLKNVRNSIGKEKSSLEAFITADVNEQDFKPWTDRSEAPETNETLEKLIRNMTGNVLQINQNLENNSKLRQSTIAITEVLKNL